jgi:hypothetical protein
VVARWKVDPGRSADALSLWLFDVSKQSWHELARGESFGYANWSSDSRFVYVLKRGNEAAIERIRVSNGKTEIVASLVGVRQTGFRNAVWTGLTPENDPLILRDVGTDELYSLNATAP